MRLCVDEILRSGRPALRLTPADGARPLRAGRYLLHAVPPAGATMPALEIDVTVEGDPRSRAGLLDFAPLFARGHRRGRAVAAFVPVFVRQEAAALVVDAGPAGAALPALAWRLQYRSYAALYAVLLARFMLRVLARRESLKLLGTAFLRHGLDGVGAALWGDWAAALSWAAPQSGFTARALACPDRVGLPAGAPAAVPGLCLVADLSRGAALPALDAGFLARARLAGFDALCLPCGWDGQQLRLPAPVQRFLDDAACDFPFILRPTGPAAADRGLMAALAPFLDDPRALRVAAAPGAVSADGVFLAGDDGAVLTGDFTAGAADPAARLPDTPPVRFGRAAHAAIGKALPAAAGRAGPAFVFVDLAAAGGPGLTDGEVGAALVFASLVSMPLVFAAGKLLDVVGRRRGAAIVFSLTSLGVILSYTLTDRWPLTAAMTLAIFGVSAVLPVLNAFTTELFPTDIRSDAFAWANNLIGRIGYVISPIAIGIAAESIGWGAAIRPTALFPMIALALIFLLLPETNRRELEETSAL